MIRPIAFCAGLTLAWWCCSASAQTSVTLGPYTTAPLPLADERTWGEGDVIRAYQCGAIYMAAVLKLTSDGEPWSWEPPDCTKYRELVQKSSP